MTGGKNSVRIVPQPKIRNKDAVDEDLVGGGLYSMSDNDISEISIMLKKLHDVNKSIRERVERTISFPSFSTKKFKMLL